MPFVQSFAYDYRMTRRVTGIFYLGMFCFGVRSQNINVFFLVDTRVTFLVFSQIEW